MVGTNGSLGSLAALHEAATQARARDAKLVVVRAWQPPGGGPGGRASCGPSVLADCRAAAAALLHETLEALVACQPGVTPAGRLVRGTPGVALVDAVRDPGDLLVVGTGSRGLLLRVLRPSVARHAWRTPLARFSRCRPALSRRTWNTCTASTSGGWRAGRPPPGDVGPRVWPPPRWAVVAG
ncbi:universal stress protein [Streptomyces sp. TX20-6-3]|uniref:universal stress protein n=1 Tax=Streptomyces sp. TX20-6-3 TaxID=3028705 RepID=UPI0029C06E1B|nr:universal stress protein [Streptomyces sp. TX20-6-3]